MKKIFKLEGLDCANCAAKIEKEVGMLDGVDSANLSFMTGRMTIEAQDSILDELNNRVETIAKKIEPDVKVLCVK